MAVPRGYDFSYISLRLWLEMGGTASEICKLHGKSETFRSSDGTAVRKTPFQRCVDTNAFKARSSKITSLIASAMTEFADFQLSLTRQKQFS